MNLCKDCKHHGKKTACVFLVCVQVDACFRSTKREISPVDGTSRVVGDAMYCEDERKDKPRRINCGLEGRFFEPKEASE